MIGTELRATVYCDHMRYDSVGIRMAEAEGRPVRCSASTGPYSTYDEARRAAQEDGWFLTLHRPHPFTYCPLHRDEARQAWGEASS